MANLTGTPDTDIIFGTSGNDTISALASDDEIYLSKGTDQIDGGEGTDLVRFQFVESQPITFRPESATLEGNGFSSQLKSVENLNVTFTNGRADTTTPNGLNNVIDASKASAGTTVDINLGVMEIPQRIKVLTNGQETASFVAKDFQTVIGTSGNDKITGNSRDNLIEGREGNDTLEGGFFAGNDTLSGGLGSDALSGGEGDDTLKGADRATYSFGQPLFGAQSNQIDTLTGGAGNDRFVLGEGNTSYYAGEIDFSKPDSADTKKAFAKITDLSGGDQIQLDQGSYTTVANPDGTLSISKQFFAGRAQYFDLVGEITFGGDLASSATSSLRSSASAETTGTNETSFTIAPGQQVGFFVGA